MTRALDIPAERGYHVAMTTQSNTSKTFKSYDAALKALALARGVKGAAGGWIYRPPVQHLTLSAGDGVPAEWRGSHVCQSWDTYGRHFGSRLQQTDTGRWYVRDAAELYEAVKAESSKCYAEYLDALAYGSPEKQAKLKAQHEGWKVRVFAAYDLAYGAKA